MIPKILHYCWFGSKPFPELVAKCIKSWQLFLPDYEIKEWNESNFDVHSILYTSQAFKVKKYAFVSDYARFKVLHQFGGIYLDTDVEILKSLDPLLNNSVFTGFELPDRVAPGLILGAEAGMPIIKEMMDIYNDKCFVDRLGKINDITVVDYTTELLKKKGLCLDGRMQKVDGITIYPTSFFSPKSLETGRLNITEETYSIHHYAGSWLSNKGRVRRYIYLAIANTPVMYRIYKALFKKNSLLN